MQLPDEHTFSIKIACVSSYPKCIFFTKFQMLTLFTSPTTTQYISYTSFDAVSPTEIDSFNFLF